MKNPVRVFEYDGKLYIRAVPCKRLLQSTLIYEVTMRGDVFAVELHTGKMTVLPANAEVSHGSVEIPSTLSKPVPCPPEIAAVLAESRKMFSQGVAAKKSVKEKPDE